MLGKSLNRKSYLGRSWNLGEKRGIFIAKIHGLFINQNTEGTFQWSNCFHSSGSFSVLLGVIWQNQSVVSALKRLDTFKYLTKTFKWELKVDIIRMFAFICNSFAFTCNRKEHKLWSWTALSIRFDTVTSCVIFSKLPRLPALQIPHLYISDNTMEC